MTRTPPVAVTIDGHRTRLKWHRARATSTDAPFTASRIVEGMVLGASIEIDLVLTADAQCAVLHDRTIERATTGTGAINAVSAAYLRTTYLRDNHGTPLDEHVLLLDDLAALLGSATVHPDAVVQLDFKEAATDLTDQVVTNFVAAVTPFAHHALLSCGDAAAVGILTDAVPTLRVGYDPCHHGAVDRVLRSRDYQRFVADAVAASPRAEIVYLDKRLVLKTARRGVDLIELFHSADREVDVYTFTGADDPGILKAIDLRANQITVDDPQGVYRRLSPVD